jgi:glycosyltransferase involved in cell wall biosynthesis
MVPRRGGLAHSQIEEEMQERTAQQRVDPTSLTVSIAIPALNEAVNIAHCLTSIRSCFPQDLNVEILVGDHGSGDGTPDVAAANGAKVVSHRGGTVGGLRNVLASHCRGSVLIFLDADTTVTPAWGSGIRAAVLDLQRDPEQITGSICAVPETGNPFIRFWFAKIPRAQSAYLGTAHLIVSAALFRRLDGFDPTLRSGEDFDFCERARNKGASILVRPELKVIHHDYPLTVGAFVLRECWHGTGDFQSFGRMLQSKVALAALFFLGTQLAALISLAFDWRGFLALELATAAFVCALSWAKFKNLGVRGRALNVAIYYLYLIGRSLAAVSVGAGKLSPRRLRNF